MMEKEKSKWEWESPEAKKKWEKEHSILKQAIPMSNQAEENKNINQENLGEENE